MLGSSVGVFVGCIWSEYGELLAGAGGGGSSQVVTGNGLAFMAGRVSYTFGLTGEQDVPGAMYPAYFLA